LGRDSKNFRVGSLVLYKPQYDPESPSWLGMIIHLGSDGSFRVLWCDNFQVGEGTAGAHDYFTVIA